MWLTFRKIDDDANVAKYSYSRNKNMDGIILFDKTSGVSTMEKPCSAYDAKYPVSAECTMQVFSDHIISKGLPLQKVVACG